MMNFASAQVTARRRARSKGSTLIETSLVLLAFVMMLIGAFDFGQFLFIQQALVERARYAARWGAINNATDSTSITNIILYDQATAPQQGTTGYFNLTASNVTVSNPDTGTNNNRLVITISGYTYHVVSPYIAGSYTGPPIVVSVPLGIYD